MFDIFKKKKPEISQTLVSIHVSSNYYSDILLVLHNWDKAIIDDCYIYKNTIKKEQLKEYHILKKNERKKFLKLGEHFIKNIKMSPTVAILFSLYLLAFLSELYLAIVSSINFIAGFVPFLFGLDSYSS